MGMCELIMRLNKVQLDKILLDNNYFWTLRNQWRGTDHCIDIDKAWAGIDFILGYSFIEGIIDPDKKVIPPRWIIKGDTPIPEFDDGYGPAHFLTPSQVSQANELLQEVSEDKFRERYDPEVLDAAGVYPYVWHRDKGYGQEFEYLLYHYKQLRNLYQKATESEEYVLMTIG